MTNYSRWDKFDPDMVCLEIEKQQAVESSKTAKKKIFQAIASENEQSILKAKRNAEALQSQADVAALKAKGVMGGRRKAKAKDDAPKDTENANNSAQPSPPAPLKARTLADRLHAVTDFLFKLLKQVEQIRVCTEKKQSHNEGYIASIRCLQDIHIFSRIKNATVMAALRATANPTPADGDKGTAPHRAAATVKIIEDLNESESFLIEQTINCLSLFALSRGEFALSVECARYVLKRQGDHADAGIWIMRGLALAASGAPYLTKLHFASANSVNSDYAGLKECSAVVEKAVVAHARQTVKCDRQELVSREVAHSLLSFFSSKAHLLHAIPDLAVITSSEVNNMLQEGSVHTAEVNAFLAQMDGTEKDPMASGDSESVNSAMAADVSSLHVDEDRSNTALAADAKVASVGNISCDAIAGALRQYVTCNTISGKSAVSSKSVGSPFSTLLNTLRTLLQPMVSDSEHLHNVFLVLASLNIVRKLFYEAQVLYLESIYQTAEIKYSAAILLINSLSNALVTLEIDTSGAMEDSNISQFLSQGLLLYPTNNADPASGVMKWADVMLHLQRLQSACFINIATCMCQHSVKLNMIIPSTTAAVAAVTTTVNSSVSIASVADLAGLTSTFTTPLHYVNHGLNLLDTLSGRFRKLFVLEKMHRLVEGLAECKHIQELLKNKDATAYTGCFVAHDLTGSELGQEYLPGFVLPMPVASVLAQNDNAASTAILIEPVDEVQKTEADLLLETEFDAIADTSGNNLSFHPVLSCSCTPSDEAVKTQVWQRQLQKKIEMFEFLIRKHGVK